MQEGSRAIVFSMNRILSGFCTFFLLVSLLSFLLFLSGNRQDFLPRSQFMLLDAIKVSSLLSLLSGLYFLFYLVAAILAKKPSKIGNVFLAIAGFVIGGGLLVLSHFILVVTQPVR